MITFFPLYRIGVDSISTPRFGFQGSCSLRVPFDCVASTLVSNQTILSYGLPPIKHGSKINSQEEASSFLYQRFRKIHCVLVLFLDHYWIWNWIRQRRSSIIGISFWSFAYSTTDPPSTFSNIILKCTILMKMLEMSQDVLLINSMLPTTRPRWIHLNHKIFPD